ncbi:MAG: hypothetical protein K9N46_02395 [Candidatus Marinimicrobia bacterium]|nr:hypothetical protein [Candidatus Neomarinimicrobiota bacterium]MCF7828254.1 hypothetical protein [Candidatus Neomarinimicrobiota bacterium]MCF7879571.1 hypothetical protein [Candidatus Neomarinimicrobiota bacterium]
MIKLRMIRVAVLLGSLFVGSTIFAQGNTPDSVIYYGQDDTMMVTKAELDSIMAAQNEPVSESESPEVPAGDGFRYLNGFRGVRWGADIQSAKAALNRQSYDRQDSTALAWYDTVAEDSVYVRLYFHHDQFWQASYTYLHQDGADLQDFYDTFRRIEEVLVKKYGNPDKMRRLTWDDSPYIGEIDAIAMGQGVYQSRWFFGETEARENAVVMDLLLQGVNFRPSVLLQYSRPSVIKPREKAEQEENLLRYY